MELALSAVQTVFAALECSQLRDLLSVWGYKSELESLHSTVETIRAVFLDADVMQAQGFELTTKQVDSIEKFKDAVYDADDLIDEFATLAAQHQQQLQNCTKVHLLFSRLEKFGAAYEMSQELTNIRNKLDGIASDVRKYSFKVDYQPIRKRREETCSFVYEGDIIGREDDKKRVIDMLLESNVQGDVAVLPIVGMGGLGKTALAQLVYNDPSIQKEFPLRAWVCVSDQDQNQFNVKAILAKIYKSVASPEVVNVDGLELELVVPKLREKLKQRKYFLVLDDLWTENRRDWFELKKYLVGLGQRGSKIVVTTRSKGTAIAVGSKNPYMLKALSHENSWNLFKRVVWGEEANHNNDLVEIGKNIVKKCANVPLAIKVMGSLLYGEPLNKWQTIQQSRLTEIKKDGNDIIPILKFSYYHLTPSLKSCFMYCALFPKDFSIEKEQLINLWMAHGYVEPLDEGQTIEEAAEEYFQILVRRCFFQDFERSENGEILIFKMHDLMHDMAQQASGKDIFIADSATTNLDKKTRHVYDSAPYGRTAGFITATKAKIRSYAKSGGRFGDVQFPVRALLENWRSVRVLDLSQLNITDLPDAIGELLHLRWLNLDGNGALEKLPKSLTKLINLQTLSLKSCYLEELPEDFCELINLRTLYVDCGGFGLRCMPLGMEKMACLTRLNGFILGQRKSRMKGEVRIEDLRVPKNLRGCLKISISPDNKHSKEYGGGGGYLCNTKYLKSVSIVWPPKYGEERMRNDDDDDDVLEDLQPHSNLKELTIKHYPRLTIPQWTREDGLASSLPNLVEICLAFCHVLNELPWLGKLQHLKTLHLQELENLEYMENKTRGTNIDSSSDGAASSSMAVEIFFPSLECLELIDLPKLKGWWRGERLPLFPRLSRVRIVECPNLRSTPVGPAVEFLSFWNSGIVEEEGQKVVGGTSGNDSGNLRSDDPKIKEIETNNVRSLNSLPMVAFQGLAKMKIASDCKIQSLSEVEEVFRGCSSSLRFLTVKCCSNLRCVSRGLHHLSALESLQLFSLYNLRFDETQGEEEVDKEDDNGMPWRCLAQCLRSLELHSLYKVVEMPKEMRYLTALQSLKIDSLPRLKDVPEWIACLSSLHSLEISSCEHLKSLPEALGSLPSLHSLEISSCEHLKSLPEALGSLPSLHSLEISWCENLESLPEALGSLPYLHSLKISWCNHLKSLSEALGSLPSLHSLEIGWCKNLESLPEALQKLTSLKRLKLESCTKILYERCKKPDGEYWPIIQHINHIENLCSEHTLQKGSIPMISEGTEQGSE